MRAMERDDAVRTQCSFLHESSPSRKHTAVWETVQKLGTMSDTIGGTCPNWRACLDCARLPFRL